MSIRALPFQLPPRSPEGHKGTFGKLYILAGSLEYSGAARLCAASALRSGCGLVRLGVPRSIWAVVAAYDPCYMTEMLEEEDGQVSLAALPALIKGMDWCDAMAIGPGLGRSAALEEVLGQLLAVCQKPLVLDADGLVLSRRHILNTPGRPWVITPHEGEFAALGGLLDKGRMEGASALAKSHGLTVHLKGAADSLTVSPAGRWHMNHTGNHGLAKGGSGDVLTGLIGSLLAQGMPCFEAAANGAHLLGLAAERVSQTLSCRGMTPEDVMREIPKVFRDLEGRLS